MQTGASVTLRWSTGTQDCFQTTQLAPGQSARSAGPPGASQRRFAARMPQGVPPTGGLPTDSQFSSDLGLRITAAKHSSRAKPLLLFGEVIAASPTPWRIPFHAELITLLGNLVTRFCEVQ
jgi:hypothetical protein